MSKLAYLADIFFRLNELNISHQGLVLTFLYWKAKRMQ